MSITSRAMLASDRWRVMCKHCLMLRCQRPQIYYPALAAVVSLIKPVFQNARAATAPAADGSGDVEVLWEIRRPVIPYVDGVIDWGAVEDDLPVPETEETWECEIATLDWTKPQSSNMHPYFHSAENLDCNIVAHKFCCPECEGSTTPKRKRNMDQAETAVAACGSVHSQPEGTFPHVPAGPSDALSAAPKPTAAPRGDPLAMPENVLNHLESLANKAPLPSAAATEKRFEEGKWETTRHPYIEEKQSSRAGCNSCGGRNEA